MAQGPYCSSVSWPHQSQPWLGEPSCSVGTWEHAATGIGKGNPTLPWHRAAAAVAQAETQLVRLQGTMHTASLSPPEFIALTRPGRQINHIIAFIWANLWAWGLICRLSLFSPQRSSDKSPCGAENCTVAACSKQQGQRSAPLGAARAATGSCSPTSHRGAPQSPSHPVRVPVLTCSLEDQRE